MAWFTSLGVMKQLETGALNEKALLVLLAHATGLSQANLKKVLTGLKQLEELYVRPQKEREKHENL